MYTIELRRGREHETNRQIKSEGGLYKELMKRVRQDEITWRWREREREKEREKRLMKRLMKRETEKRDS